MSLIDISEQTIKISIHYEEKKTKYGYTKPVVLTDEELEELEKVSEGEEDKKRDVKVLNTEWQVMSWKDDTQIARDSTFTDSVSGTSDFDPYRFRDLRVKKCLIGWDLKDDQGQPIVFRSELVDKLPSDFVFFMIRKYEEAIGIVTGEEEKK